MVDFRNKSALLLSVEVNEFPKIDCFKKDWFRKILKCF